MEPTRASLTAMGAALMRAAHTRRDRPPLVDDPWGERLVTASDRARLRDAVPDRLPPRAHPSYGAVILRARFTEDALEQAVARGVRQYVLVGAGLDSFALRRPPWAERVAVFELDHQATQQLKLRRLRGLGIDPGAIAHHVEADLASEPLDVALDRSPFDRSLPAFFAWLGVSAYLTRDANLRTLSGIARSGAAGSELVFSYLDQRRLDAPNDAQRRLHERFAAIGEPWLSGFHPGRIARDLRAVGLSLVEDLDYTQVHARYRAGRHDGLSTPAGGRLARALVAA